MGAIDNFKLNTSVNDDVTDSDIIKRNNYILGNIPVQQQWNYTIGASYKHYGENSTQQLVLSRNEWENNAKKYFNNTNNSNDLLLDYSSKEVENKFRFENTSTSTKNYKINVGFGLEQADYFNDTFQQLASSNGVSTIDFSSKLSLLKYSLFGQVSKRYLNSKLGTSFGVRFDGTDYSNEMSNPFKQFSPRFSIAYSLTDKTTLNASVGKYFQLPTYTILGFRDNLCLMFT